MGLVPYDVSITYCEISDVIRINANEGRLIQACLIVKNSVLECDRFLDVDPSRYSDSFSQLIKTGIVEFLDAQEMFQPFLHCASNRDEITPLSTHMLMSPGAIFGFMASLVPVPEMNQCTRTSYYTAMSKTAMPSAHTTYNNWSTIQYGLQTPQLALVNTQTEYVMGLEESCDGVNVVVAIFLHPNAQEDSFVFRKSFLDRSGMQTVVHHVYHCTMKPFEKGYNCGLGEDSHVSLQDSSSASSFIGEEEVNLTKKKDVRTKVVVFAGL